MQLHTPLAIVIAACLAAGGPATADAAPTRACGTLVLSDGYVHVKATGKLTCRTAMRVLRTHFDGPPACSEWSCATPARGWRCRDAPVRSFPRLATCRRGAAVAAAYSFAA